jgi:hypothetical protein
MKDKTPWRFAGTRIPKAGITGHRTRFSAEYRIVEELVRDLA